MSKLTSNALVQPLDLYKSSATVSADLGALGVTGDGREFRYVKAGASALVPGTLQQAPAVTANLQDVTVTAATAAGATEISFTISSTTITANSLDGGIVAISDNDGQGQVARIASHNSGTITTLTLKLEDPLAIATSSTSQACILPNPYNGVIINPTTPTNKPVGVAISAIPAGYYGWIQTKGIVSCLNDSNTAVGLAVAPSGAVAGAVKTGATTLDSIGSAAQAGVDTEYRLVDIRL